MVRGTTVVGYVRVSTGEQGESGAGLEAQRDAIAAACRERGWRLLDIEQDVASGKTTAGREGLARAVNRVESGEAGALVVAKLDRATRSLQDFATLMERSRQAGWTFVALDLGVDTSTPAGELMANVLASFAQFERRVIGQRTREALAVKRAQGVQLGRRPALDRRVRDRVRRMRSRGSTLQQIADRLNRDGVPTPAGGQGWHPTTVRRALA